MNDSKSGAACFRIYRRLPGQRLLVTARQVGSANLAISSLPQTEPPLPRTSGG